MNISIFLLIFLIFILSSCGSSSIVSIAGNAAITEKGIKSSLDDTLIYTKIKAKLTKLKISNITDLSISVSQGRVLLVGTMEENSDRLSAIKVLWQIKGVKEIFNEIRVNEVYTITEKAKDILLTSKIRTLILFNFKIYSNNYSIDAYKGIIYLLGISKNLEEREIIENYIKNISGVKKLVTFIYHSPTITKEKD
tara:strand:- start:406 stop:990 length:585 start_codon:yes stop_codon:yes gene_type:complete